MDRLFVIVLTGFTIALMSGCSQDRPVIYPSYYSQPQVVERDLYACKHTMQTMGIGQEGKNNLMMNMAKSGLQGALAGTVVAAISGNSIKNAALVGGALKAVHEFSNGVLSTSPSSDAAPKRQFMEQCLHEKGHRVVGWK